MLGIYAQAASARDACASTPCPQKTPVYSATYSQADADKLEPGSSFHEGHTCAWYNIWSIFTIKRQFVART